MGDSCRSTGRHHGGGGAVAAPFVVKTYRLVDDPSTDAVIAWGRDKNSFVVVDPFAFSQTLLPSHFKHGNFSSFIRQLNTYGFRKVDPDRWEFAHTSFLRGQTHLLKQIVRRSSGGVKKKEREEEEEEEEEERVVEEVVRLKQEQRRIEERMQGMWRRVLETERRPRQMLAFLVKVAGDPELVDRLGGQAAEVIEGGQKRARLPMGDDVGGGRMVDVEDRVLGSDHWHFGEQVMGKEEEEGDGRQFLGSMDDPTSEFYEFGGGAAAYPFPFHVGSEF
ncbi:heat stress transcription factor C-2a-like [Canna indica]|uniref:Heat stress transcription factor C-2a-like n=1 Tax=Canna indica TaxID=4628 RepID=A0AAQ3KI22_9LILI|nr:heat stress transcription factor C-2a-like [Canna indica]